MFWLRALRWYWVQLAWSTEGIYGTFDLVPRVPWLLLARDFRKPLTLLASPSPPCVRRFTLPSVVLNGGLVCRRIQFDVSNHAGLRSLPGSTASSANNFGVRLPDV